jgi:hypothetical protein
MIREKSDIGFLQDGQMISRDHLISSLPFGDPCPTQVAFVGMKEESYPGLGIQGREIELSGEPTSPRLKSSAVCDRLQGSQPAPCC